MTNVLILVFSGLVVVSGVIGYCLGRYQNSLIDKIRTLEGQSRQEPAPEPEKPVVTGGAYQPPHEVSTSTDKKRAGLVETKTPERLDWESKNELAKLEHGA